MHSPRIGPCHIGELLGNSATRALRPRHLAWLCAVLFALLASESPSAAKPGRLSCGDNPECDRLASEARDHSKAGQYDDAQRCYEQAYQRVADPMLLFNLARVLHKAGRPALAAAQYQRFLDAPLSGAAEEERSKAQQYLKQAQSEAAAAPAAGTGASGGAAVDLTAKPGKSDGASTPLYRKWWLWTAVGAGAAVIIIGIAAGAAPHRPDVSGLPAAYPFGP